MRDNWESPAAYVLWKDQAHSFESMIAYGNQDLAFMAAGESTQERIASITENFWSVTRAQAEFGRLFAPGEPEMWEGIALDRDRAWGTSQRIRRLTPRGIRLLFENSQYGKGCYSDPQSGHVKLEQGKPVPITKMTLVQTGLRKSSTSSPAVGSAGEADV